MSAYTLYLDMYILDISKYWGLSYFRYNLVLGLAFLAFAEFREANQIENDKFIKSITLFCICCFVYLWLVWLLLSVAQ